MVTPILTMAPATQAPKVAVAPTERSIPAVIRVSNIPVESRALKEVCFKMDIKFALSKKLGEANANAIHRMISAANVPI